MDDLLFGIIATVLVFGGAALGGWYMKRHTRYLGEDDLP